ncbi:hypothetical protein L2725_10695 [Shewanella corallii]|uniref:DUF4156 domain-containing protein n=1 Tax=Shewanella corallii TaxID=560080 RepID=A0ABT0N781_9GAMM|nr:hypothetical protein [Shewanella corallii]MCL2914235.1 hypothetical protein [Shewanella corallii]
MLRQIFASLTVSLAGQFLSACSLTSESDSGQVQLITSERQLPGPCEHLGFIEVSESGLSIESAHANAEYALSLKAAERKASHVSLNQQEHTEGILLYTQNLGGNIYRCNP